MNRNHPSSRSVVKKRKKKRIRRRVILAILIPIVVLFAGVASYGAYLYSKADDVISDSFEDVSRDKSPLRDAEIDPSIDNVSILIIGVDENDHRENQGNGLSDALMLATFNKGEKSIKLLSIPRDSLVYIPEVAREDKINHAHAFGGPEATIETVEYLLEIPVDYYVKLNFHAFVEVIDALGGIEVEVPYEFTESNSMDKRDAIHLYPGKQVLYGEEALALARTRKLDNDIERGKRQQEIVKAVLKKTVSVGSVMNYDDVLEAVGNNMKTNMTFSDMKTFISYAASGMNLDIETLTLEGQDYQPNGIYYYQLDPYALSEVKSTLQNHLELTTTVNSNTTPEVNASGSDISY